LTELTKQRDDATEKANMLIKEKADLLEQRDEATAKLSKIRSSWNEFISFLL
jgi:predicted nuclease with TOPRIM domain